MKTKIKKDMIVCGKDSAPLGTVEARVESIGEIDRRVSFTRVAFTAGVGLLWKKRVDHRQLFLTIEGPGIAWVDELSVKEQAAARKLAATINAAKAQRDAIDAANKGNEPIAVQAVAPAPVNETDELLKLVQLRDAGVLTESEFTTRKNAVMGISAGDWAPDPTGRHKLRWWNGSAWTSDVNDDGLITDDPV